MTKNVLTFFAQMLIFYFSLKNKFYLPSTEHYYNKINNEKQYNFAWVAHFTGSQAFSQVLFQ